MDTPGTLGGTGNSTGNLFDELRKEVKRRVLDVPHSQRPGATERVEWDQVREKDIPSPQEMRKLFFVLCRIRNLIKTDSPSLMFIHWNLNPERELELPRSLSISNRKQ